MTTFVWSLSHTLVFVWFRVWYDLVKQGKEPSGSNEQGRKENQGQSFYLGSLQAK